MIRTSRRQFLLAGGAAALLVACGDDAKTSDLSVVLRNTNGKLFVPGESRLAISLVDSTQTLVGTGPKTLQAAVVDQQGKEVVGKLTADLHADKIPQAYWPFRFTIPAAGFYQLRVDGVSSTTANFGVFDPREVTMPYIGSVLAPFDTPTVADHRGVEPYCSLTPNPCPLHDVTLTDALKTGKPVVYMIGTPAHCQTGACAPALEFLVATHARVGDAVTMVHADVYADNAGTTFAPAVVAVGIDYEPVVYFCKPDGTIVDRLDGIWDQAEIDQRVDALTAA
ncbi:MAG: hypothetical protein JWM12_2577 [Ilumatobacteraceae bacterium]|nr:hypothetical protein [Ilumatobacteraceae bacterium]